MENSATKIARLKADIDQAEYELRRLEQGQPETPGDARYAMRVGLSAAGLEDAAVERMLNAYEVEGAFELIAFANRLARSLNEQGHG